MRAIGSSWGLGAGVDDATNLIIFLIVVGLRLLAPLLIPRYPLPAIIFCMLVDAADQTIFQKWTTLDLTSYQSYDKALDVYYLVIAYLATLRNWRHLFSVQVAQFLIYYRLIGVGLFESFHERWLLLVFPNTFEYFFDWYEAVRLRWDPIRMTHHIVLGAAAFIWIVIKLPQEYWLHVAQRDVTDTLRANPVLIPLIGIAVVGILVLAWWVVTKKCPPADYPFSLKRFESDPIEGGHLIPARFSGWKRYINPAALEKILLLTLVSFIFSKMLPGVNATAVQVAINMIILVVANAFVSEVLRQRGIVEWNGAMVHFLGVLAVNAGIALLMRYLLPIGEGRLDLGDTLFFLFLLSLMVTLYDRYHPIYDKRRDEAGLRMGSSF